MSISGKYTAIVIILSLIAAAAATIAAERLLVTGMISGFYAFFESLAGLARLAS